MECTKDVSSLVNADGGIILIGVQTERDAVHQGDIIRRVGCFARGRIDFAQYQNVLAEWLCHRYKGLGLNGTPAQQTGTRELHQSSFQKSPVVSVPILSQRLSRILVESSVRMLDSERIRDNATPMKPGELRDRIKDGRRFAVSVAGCLPLPLLAIFGPR
jgi:hypothetical protein